jgi:hypothetical protein
VKKMGLTQKKNNKKTYKIEQVKRGQRKCSNRQKKESTGPKEKDCTERRPFGAEKSGKGELNTFCSTLPKSRRKKLTNMTKDLTTNM